MPLALGQDVDVPPHVREIVSKARISWLKNSEVLDLLLNYRAYNLPVGSEAPHCPGGGCLFLFNRKLVRFFRKDGHEWRKKSDGKTVRETHEKLKIDNRDALNCYYAHAEAKEALQRRCYWLLKGDADTVLVHYLSSTPGSRGSYSQAADSSSDDMLVAHCTMAGGCSMSRSESTPTYQSADSVQTAVTITTGRSLHRAEDLTRSASCGRAGPASELAPHRIAPEAVRSLSVPVGGERPACAQQQRPAPLLTFSGATVQTGFSGCSAQSRHPLQPACNERAECAERMAAGDIWRSSGPGGLPDSSVSTVASEDLRPGSADREREDSRPGEAEASGGLCELKPAMSLTRVDSDTLRVAPSLSRATSGAGSRGLGAVGAHEPVSERPTLPSSACSPFFAAAFSGDPIKRLQGSSAASMETAKAWTAPAKPLQMCRASEEPQAAHQAAPLHLGSRWKRQRCAEADETLPPALDLISPLAPATPRDGPSHEAPRPSLPASAPGLQTCEQALSTASPSARPRPAATPQAALGAQPTKRLTMQAPGCDAKLADYDELLGDLDFFPALPSGGGRPGASKLPPPDLPLLFPGDIDWDFRF